MQKIFKGIIIIFVGLVLVIASSYFYILKTKTPDKVNKSDKPLYWVAPMNPNYKSDKPGKSPMGMDLVPVYGKKSSSKGVIISPNIINNIGIRVEKVESRELQENINTLGIVKEKKDNIDHVHIYREGWVKKLNIDDVGDKVQKGDLLAQIYSPLLLVAEKDLITAMFRDKSMLEGSRSRLFALGVSPQQIKRIESKKRAEPFIDIIAPISGVISELNTREGMYIAPQTNILTIVDLDTVWLSAEVFPQQINNIDIHAGYDLIASIAGTQEKFIGKIDFISPEIDPITRTVSVRATLRNKDDILRPNLYMDVSIVHKLPKALTIPSSSIIRLKDINYVIIQNKNKEFSAQEVILGQSAQGYTQILKGLALGDEVVTSSQFLIDSESNVQESLKRLTHSNIIDKDSDQATTFNAKGIIKNINNGNNSITLLHQKMNMSMDFKLDKNIDINSLKLEQSISFKYIKNNKENTIISIDKGSSND
ncbi:hemolysin D (plasmid) [Francisella halioticida]|uniref:efflux RND transporter periplasmic adaptor subunit n=1 Tax=Francisella halioticida TaxID=549298 RepID=UPI001AF5F25C|nr:efflux RND transporter periplasmic adaptor subunit [Francisella halioticida]BCD92637.1 hemolysin D [Francisella halioticida]